MKSVSLWLYVFVCISVSADAMCCGCMCSFLCSSLWVPCVVAWGCGVGRLKSNFLRIKCAAGAACRYLSVCLSVFLPSSHIQVFTPRFLFCLNLFHSPGGYYSSASSFFSHSLNGFYYIFSIFLITQWFLLSVFFLVLYLPRSITHSLDSSHLVSPVLLFHSLDFFLLMRLS